MNPYKPEIYNSLSRYQIVDDAQNLVELSTSIDGTWTIRRFEHQNGKIAHIDLQLDDTVILISDSAENFRANLTVLHICVPDVFKTFDKAIENGCSINEKPTIRQDYPNTKKSFHDFASNYWAVSTQNWWMLKKGLWASFILILRR